MSAGAFCTLWTLVNRNAQLYPNKIAMKEAETGKSCTFEELRDRVNKIGNALRRMGAKKRRSGWDFEPKQL